MNIIIMIIMILLQFIQAQESLDYITKEDEIELDTASFLNKVYDKKYN